MIPKFNVLNAHELLSLFDCRLLQIERLAQSRQGVGEIRKFQRVLDISTSSVSFIWALGSRAHLPSVSVDTCALRGRMTQASARGLDVRSAGSVAAASL
jgi:hypothetical protein